MRVLLIYEQVPETTTFYTFDEPNEELLNLFEACNGKMINSDDSTPEMQILSDALSEKKEHCGNPDHHLACTIKGGVELPPAYAFDRVFLFGFLC